MAGADGAYAFVHAFIDELVRAGVRHVCFSPGSRSTPLVLTAARLSQLRLWQHIDERSAGFFALGLAKQLNEPVALMCSSGTAAANFLPAVVEAYFDRVPLIVLTADRPPELQNSGAPQTIHQHELYGKHVKHFIAMPVPTGDAADRSYARNAAGQLVSEAVRAPMGPVHANFPLREPLLAENMPDVATDAGGREGQRCYTQVHPGNVSLRDDDVGWLVDELSARRRGLIVCGPQRDKILPDNLVALGRALAYPVLADPLSGLRYDWDERDGVIDAYDAFLRHNSLTTGLEPEVILRFGAWPTSKALSLYLQQHANARHIVIDDAGGWRDPLRLAAHVVQANPRAVSRQLLDNLPEDLAYTKRSWWQRWLNINTAAGDAIRQKTGEFTSMFEGRVFSELTDVLPPRTILYVGNSMPVRDLDTFGFNRTSPLQCHANRGANGIDGVVSSALGAAAGSKYPVVLVIGDLSFYHDLNGLLAAKLHDLNLTVVLVHNDGGGIFSFLPQARLTETFEPLFGTPHGLDFAPAVHMYGGTFVTAKTWEQFRQAVSDSVAGGGLHVVQVTTDRRHNELMHREVWDAVKQYTAVVADA